ncbi:MAG TPA: SpoIIE family protein phosphatase [Terracidiphilus sp.]|nr:SpoIIE family protein phosphatase [Terracidiphilus sp.]
MLPRAALIAVLFSGLAAVSAISQQSQTPPAVLFDGGTATLDGPWQFHLGDDPRWSSRDFDDAAWEKMSPDRPWGAQGHEDADGFAWYRRRIEVTPASRAPDSLAVLIPYIEDAYEVYWNGRLVGQYGKLPPHPVWRFFRNPSIFMLGPAQPGVLAVRVWKSPFMSFDSGTEGGMNAPPILGSPEAIETLSDQMKYGALRSQQLEYGLTTLYALVAILAFLGWLRDRRTGVALWMAGFAAVQPLVQLLILWYPSSIVMSGLGGIVYSVGDVSLLFLLLWLLDLRSDRRIFRLTTIVAICILALYVVDPFIALGILSANPSPWQVMDLVLMAPLDLVELFPFVLIGIAVARRQKLDIVRWSVAILAFLSHILTVGPADLEQGRRFTHITLGPVLQAPIAVVYGNAITVQQIAGTLLLLALVWAVYRYSSAARREQARLETEMRNARAVQQVLIPDERPVVPGFQIEAIYKPATEVGGDFFQILPLAEGAVLAAIGDVSGKGLPAAMTVSLLVGTLRTLAHYTQSPAEILSAMNHRMLGRTQGGFTTCLILRIEADGAATIANAGHISPYVEGRELAVEGGLPLGLAPGAEYAETIFSLSADAKLTLVTDGVVEARASDGELLGFERTAALSSQSAESIAATAQQFGQEDDITVLTLRRSEVADQIERVAAGASSIPLSQAKD